MNELVFVCGADEAARAALEASVRSAGARCAGFASPEALLGALSGEPPDAVLLFAAGDEARRVRSELRAVCPDCALLLAAEGSRGAMAALALRFDGLLPLPASAEAAADCLRGVFAERPWAVRTLPGGKKGAATRLRDILFVESANHSCRVYLRDGSAALLRMPLNELERETEGCGFVRCHRSFLVNLRRAAGYENGCLLLPGGHAVPVSKALRERVIRLLRELRLREYLRAQEREGIKTD